MRVGLTAPPHLVFVLVDDLGFADIFGRSPDIQTPHWDALAASGVTMARFYCGFYVQPLCTPARGAFLTGRYPVRLGLQRGVLHPDSVRGLPLDEVTLTQRLKYAGYATAIHFLHEMIILPRQAQDKHRESTQKRPFSQRSSSIAAAKSVTPSVARSAHKSLLRTRPLVRKNAFCPPFHSKNDHFTKTGSGQT
jgi:hypothetical protein